MKRFDSFGMVRALRAVCVWALARPYPVVFALSGFFFFGYLSGVKIEASVFADGAGRWLQIQGLIAQNFSSFACHYDTAFDPEFRWRPGPGYFYYIVDDFCFYFYQYPYALLAAPFVYWAPDYGYFVLNFLCLLLFVFATMRTAREIFDNPGAELAIGLIAVLVIPSATFAYDLSELMLFLAMLACGLCFVVRGLGWKIETRDSPGEAASASAASVEPRPPAAAKPLIIGGFLIGLAFALRTEAAIFLAAIAGSLFLIAFVYNDGRNPDADVETTRRSPIARFRHALALPIPFALGATAGLAMVVAFHYAVFGNIAGNRGTAHADQVLAEFTIAGQLEIARLLLFGGSLGLFTSLPSIALAGLWALFPGARKAAGPMGAFLFVLSVAYIAAVLVIAPNDGGYSWSPRYLACVFAPLYLCILMIFRGWKVLHRRYVFALIGVLALYSVHYTHTGMKILQRTSKQNLAYSSAIEGFALDVVVFDAPPAIGFVSEEILTRKRLYMALDADSAHDLVARLAETGVHEFLYLRTPLREPSFQLEMPVTPRGQSDQSRGGVFRSVQQVQVEGMQIHRMRLESAAMTKTKNVSGNSRTEYPAGRVAGLL